jgi:hypothetical protein
MERSDEDHVVLIEPTHQVLERWPRPAEVVRREVDILVQISAFGIGSRVVVRASRTCNLR